MVVVPAGSYMMGSLPNEKDTLGSGKPRHQVTIAKAFAVARFELTFDQWDTCVAYGDCPEIVDDKWGRGSQPVINVTWDDALQYVRWLSTTTGKPYRLLTEAEYEHAARGGTNTQYPWGDSIPLDGRFDEKTSMANCKGCDELFGVRFHSPAPVGLFPPNGFGLYDMVGNVWEWLQDCEHDNYDGAPTDMSAWIEGGDCQSRVIRGGSWDSDPDELRVAYRTFSRTDRRANDRGLRVARTLGP
jgi:formylglycine-generating enzyme required for sulfatase activity